MIELTNLHTESDVEQKLIYPLLIDSMPHGLGIPPACVYTKSSIRSIVIDKGASKKNYFPDYIVAVSGIPLLVAEAKSPGEDLEEALREARLYASELNARFSHEIDPVKFVLACNGETLVAGFHNESTARFALPIEKLSIADLTFSKFVEEFSYTGLYRWNIECIKKLRPKRYWRPRKLVGGLAAQNEEVGLNSFGTTIKADFRGLFDPANIHERDVIASECYIPSKRRDRYVDAIDRTFKAIVPPSERNASPIDDTGSPQQIIKKLRLGEKLNNQVMLLIGAAGAGKTTFVDYLRVKALPSDVRRSTRWIHVNMNEAPVSRDEVYSWLRRQIVQGVRELSPSTDFDDIETLRKIFRSDIERFRKGVGRLLEASPELYNQKLAELITQCLGDEQGYARSMCKFLSSRESALIVIVLDNCDKREMKEQLLMFEAAQWLRTEFNALVFLPLREETYDNNLSVPPLDTALKDLAFRIEPPRFDLILRSRVDFAIRKLSENPDKKFSYDLPNSMRATYTAADKISYLGSILRSIFETDQIVRRLLIGLAGRNMRRAMEIFLEFCSSGHISEDEIVKMVQSRGSYSLPMSLVSRVILRSKKRYYDGDHSYVVNLFAANIDDRRPNPFIRIAILRYLFGLAHDGQGPRMKGYRKVKEIFDVVKTFGADEVQFLREIHYLAKSYCLITEDFRVEGLSFEDLVTIGPAGRTHLYLIGNIHYLAAMAEDAWFRDEALAESIATRIRNPSLHFDNRTVLINAKTLTAFLDSESCDLIDEHNAVFSETDVPDLLTTSPLRRTVLEREKQMAGDWAGIDERHPVGKIFIGVIKNIKPFGFFVDLEPGIRGLIHSSKINAADQGKSVGDAISVRILQVDQFERKVTLESAYEDKVVS